MPRTPRFSPALKLLTASIGVAMVLAGCGGGGGGGSTASAPEPARAQPAATTANPVAGHLERLNEVRVAMGMAALVSNGALQTAAEKHAAFLTANQVFGHAEWVGGKNFYAAGIGDRAALAGYRGSLVGEVVVGSTGSTTQDGRNLMDVALVSPGHRSVLLAPEFKEIGIANGPMVSQLGAVQANWVAADALFTYPYPRQASVQTVFAPGAEDPNPLPGVAETGMPLSIHTRLFSSFVVRGATLRNAVTGAPVELLDNPDIGQTRSAFTFYPRLRLATNTAYVFTVDSEMGGKARRLETAFTTGAI